jgi:transcriptional regulator with XRE-family HTH domain
MSIADGDAAAHDGVPATEGRAYDECNGWGSWEAKDSRFARAKRPLHRLATVRKRQGISLRNVAGRLGVDTATVCQQEQETTDLPLSMIYAWQTVLDVPAVELLVDSDTLFSPTVLDRARLVRVMKTAASIREKARSNSLKGLVATLIEDLLEIMPELREVGAWNTVGQRRTQDEYGQAVARQLPDEYFRRKVR